MSLEKPTYEELERMVKKLTGEVHKRKRTEEILREEEQRYRSLTETLPDAIMVYSEGKIALANPAAGRLCGVTDPEQLIGKSIMHFVPLDCRDGIKEQIRQTIEDGKQVPFVEQKFKQRDGTIVEIEVATVPFTYQFKPAAQVIARDITERKRTEEALQRSEKEKTILNQIATIFLAIPDEAMYEEVLAVVLRVMRSKYGIFGFIGDQGELIIPSLTRDIWNECQVPDKSFVFPSDSWGDSIWGRAIREKKAFCLDGPFRTPEGHIHLDYFLTVPIVFGQQTIGLISVANKEGGYTEDDKDFLERIARNNISPILHARLQRDKLEQERKQAEELFKSLAVNSPVGVYIVQNGKFIYANPQFQRDSGYREDELLGMDSLGLVFPEDREAVRNNAVQMLKENHVIPYEFRINNKKGETKWALESVAFIQRQGKQATMSSYQDITERKRAEQELKDREEELAAIYDNAPIIMLLVDENWTIRKTNAFTAQSVGTTTGAMVNRRCGEALRCIHAFDSPEGCGFGPSCKECALRLTILNTIETGRSHHEEEIRVSFSDGENEREGAFLISTKKLFVREQPLALVSMQDITERKQAEQQMLSLQAQLLQSQKMEAIGRLAGGVAHDFNNLLTVIMGYCELSLLDLSKDDPGRQKLNEISKAAERAGNLTRQLLAFSRRQILEMKVVNLNIILGDLDKMLRRVIGEDIELATILSDKLGMVKIDPGQMEQVVVNLVVNAKDAMPKGGKLTLETTNAELDEGYTRSHAGMIPGDYVMLSVSDSGAGMTREVQEQIFDPFFTTKEKGKGTGLGLSTVYGIVKQSGGEIYVYSEIGKGTTFKIYLPRVFEPLEELKKEVPVDKIPQGNETVLVAEDDGSVRKLAVDILRMYGYKVLEATGGEEALIIYEKEKNPIHLILTDVVMPKMNGPQLIERLKQAGQDFKVLYMSGYADETVIHHRLLERGVNIIHKPFTVEKLARKVRDVLDKN